MKRRLAWLCLLLLALMTPAQALAATIYESSMILINKEHGLPKDYVPSDLTPVNVTFAEGVVQSKKQMRAEAARESAAAAKAATVPSLSAADLSPLPVRTQR